MLLEPAALRTVLEGSTETPYLDALTAYAAGDPVRLTVPGHKGGSAAPDALVDLLGGALALDLPTLIGGVDSGSAPTPLERALAAAAAAWGARRTWFLPHGATQGNLAACLALRAARGRQVVVQRNVHSSVVSGLISAGVAPHWLAPEVDYAAGVAHGVTPAALDAALSAAPGARAAFVVAPTYHGAMPDVAALAAIAHEHGAALVVDEAWGAHLPFHPALPQHAIAAGRRPRRLEHAQVARQPVGVGDAAPGTGGRVPAAGRGDRPGARPVRVDVPERAGAGVARRCACPRGRAWRAPARRDAARRGGRPRSGSPRSRACAYSGTSSSARPACMASTRCA